MIRGFVAFKPEAGEGAAAWAPRPVPGWGMGEYWWRQATDADLELVDRFVDRSTGKRRQDSACTRGGDRRNGIG
jgi:hypothetical protein